eukprot:jgi/Tetstr1/438922/TSEL_027430.t1
MIDFACVSSTTPTWSNDPRWCTPGIAATEAEHGKLAADRASSAPVQGVHRYCPFVVEDRGRLGKSALTVVYIFAVLLADGACLNSRYAWADYAQTGRMPGWFNRLFASARLVEPVKKLGEGRAPDVRPVAVGEVERRAAERAVVYNMKEAYVSVLAPSQLGVGISAGDSMLSHGVRLIAEKLGPRAIIVHTYLRNAYNEAWRRTIIQRHIDCSQPHPDILALLASLSTDSYLVVDDRTLEVSDGAARFNADDGFLVGLPEHVWPALHAFRTSIKASVGLEVEAFAEPVVATVLAAVERVLGVSFDPSTYNTDANPVVTDFLAELLHDPDPMAACGVAMIPPTARTVMTPHELREVAAGYLFLPSPYLAPVVGSQIIMPWT